MSLGGPLSVKFPTVLVPLSSFHVLLSVPFAHGCPHINLLHQRWIFMCPTRWICQQTFFQMGPARSSFVFAVMSRNAIASHRIHLEPDEIESAARRSRPDRRQRRERPPWGTQVKVMSAGRSLVVVCQLLLPNSYNLDSNGSPRTSCQQGG